MDPQHTLFLLLDAMDRNDRQGVDDHLVALRNWNRCGGFLPTVDRPSNQSVTHYVVRREITEAGPLPCDLAEPRVVAEAAVCEVSPGEHVLLPSDWLDDDSELVGELTEVGVVQRDFPSHVEDGRYYVVSPLWDDYREKKVAAKLVEDGRAAWIAENQTMGSGSHGAEDFEEID